MINVIHRHIIAYTVFFWPQAFRNSTYAERNLDGQTNVNLKNRCIAFDVNEDNIGKDLLPALMYIAFDCVYDLVKGDKDNFDMKRFWNAPQ